MRTEQEMMDLIINTAKEDERIRAVLMDGSRANPAVPKDKYQDYDIGYYVNDVTPFYNNPAWVEEKFGKPLIMQMPENMELLPHENDGHFTYLTIFTDGNRIDLSFYDKPYIDNGEPAVVLLDKDGFLPKLPSPSDKVYFVTRPTQKLFSDCCNEFWWCLNNSAKGIARDEIPYAMHMYNVYIRKMLDKMIDWYIGAETDFSVSTGKNGKYYKKYLPDYIYELYIDTYAKPDYENFWLSIFTACGLFRITSEKVAVRLGFIYNFSEEEGIRKYLNDVRKNRL